MLAYSINTDSVTVVTKSGELQTYSRDTEKGKAVVEFIKNNDEDGLVDYLESFKRIVEKTYGETAGFRVENDVVFVPNAETGGEDSLPMVLGKRVVQFANEGLPIEYLLRFWHKLSRNPSYRAVQRLFDYLDANGHVFLPDGRFLAWKRVDVDFKDFHSRTFDNSVGQKPKMNRNQVDEDDNNTCSNGLHVANYNYANVEYAGSNGHLLEVAVDPEHVVAIPKEYKERKIRVCEYEVLKVVKEGCCLYKEENKELVYHYDDECPYCGYPENDCECDDTCEGCGEDWANCCCKARDEEGCLDCGEALSECACDCCDDSDEYED